MKKKFILTACLSLAAATSLPAANPMPMLEIGKRWVWTGIEHCAEDGIMEKAVYFTVEDTEIIDGKTCYRVDQTSEIDYLDGKSYLLYEEPEKLYICLYDTDATPIFMPLLNFSLTTGDTQQCYEIPVAGYGSSEYLELKSPPENYMTVAGEDEVTVGRKTFRRMNLHHNRFNKDITWVEGVGVTDFKNLISWIQYPEADNGKYLGSFKECQLGSQTIFSVSDFDKLNQTTGPKVYITKVPMDGSPGTFEWEMTPIEESSDCYIYYYGCENGRIIDPGTGLWIVVRNEENEDMAYGIGNGNNPCPLNVEVEMESSPVANPFCFEESWYGEALVKIDKDNTGSCMAFFTNESSGVSDVVVESAAGDIIYDVMGRSVKETVPGSVYIRGGKKFVAR